MTDVGTFMYGLENYTNRQPNDKLSFFRDERLKNKQAFLKALVLKGQNIQEAHSRLIV